MSEPDNIKVVQRAYAAGDRGEFHSFVEVLAEDVEWTFPGPVGRATFFGEFHGRDESMQALKPFLEFVETRQLQPRQFIASGETVVVLEHELEHEEVKVRRTGCTCLLDCVHVITMRNGRIVAVKQIGDTAKLLQTLEV